MRRFEGSPFSRRVIKMFWAQDQKLFQWYVGFIVHCGGFVPAKEVIFARQNAFIVSPIATSRINAVNIMTNSLPKRIRTCP